MKRCAKCVMPGTWLSREGIGTALLESGEPSRKKLVESFLERMWDERLSCVWCYRRKQERIVIDTFRRPFSEDRAHSSLGYQETN